MANTKCPECGKTVADGDRICGNCGFPLLNTETETQDKPTVLPADGADADKITKTHGKARSGHKKRRRISTLLCGIVFIAILVILSITVVMPGIQYINAKELLQNKDYVSAFAAFEELGNYMNAAELAKQAQSNVYYTLSVEDIISENVGYSYIEFGGENWNILAIEGDKALLLSANAVAWRPYNEKNMDVTWETSDLREYLNGEYYKTFNDEERAMIIPVQNQNPSNNSYGTVGGATTTDKIFLLSSQEAEIYAGKYKRNNTVSWWLRSPGRTSRHAACITKNGDLSEKGVVVTRVKEGVRPALWIRISFTEDDNKIINQIGLSVKDGKATINMGGYVWRILDISQNQLLVITDEIVETRTYPVAEPPIWGEVEYGYNGMWEYLNGEFLGHFSEEEKIRMTLQNYDVGKIFLLSYEEVEKYFGYSARYDKPNLSNDDIIRDNIRNGKIAKYRGNATAWWLRDNGYDGAYAVSEEGEICSKGNGEYAGIRPAMWIDINTEYSKNPVSINQDVLSDIGRTYGELSEKYGRVIRSDYLYGGKYFVFENSPACYFFEDAPGSGTAPNGMGDTDIDENSACFWIHAGVQNFFNDFKGLKYIDDIEKEIGISIVVIEDMETCGYSCWFDYQGFDISIDLGDSQIVISENSYVDIRRE